MGVFEFHDYKTYLKSKLGTFGAARGTRSRLAITLDCQAAYISQVLNGHGHFSLEHAALIDEFLVHSGDESEYFMLLVHLARAGNRALARTYERRMQVILAGRRSFETASTQPEPMELSKAAVYYRTWQMMAVHVTLMTGPHDVARLVRRLGIPQAVLKEDLKLLQEIGLVTKQNDLFSATSAMVHLPANSSLGPQHHRNWRLRAINEFERGPHRGALHYSGALAISRKTANAILKVLVQAIEEISPLAARSEEIDVYVIAMDFFKLTEDAKEPLVRVLESAHEEAVDVSELLQQ